MPKAIICENPGQQSSLTYSDIQLPELGPDQVLIRHIAIEVNYIDAMLTEGQYPLPASKVLGCSAVGVIEKLGSNVAFFKEGAKVAYVTSYGGAYATHNIVDSNKLFAVPATMDDKIIASCILKAMTAHYLCTRVFLARKGVTFLIQPASSGVGQLLAQYSKHHNATVIGCVSSDEKMDVAKSSGCDFVVNNTHPNWPSKVLEFLEGDMINVVYDSLGAAQFENNCKTLNNTNMYVSYGEATGKLDPLQVMKKVHEKSLYFSAPSLFIFKRNWAELILTADDIYTGLKTGWLRPPAYIEYALKDASEALNLVKSRKATGSIILIP